MFEVATIPFQTMKIFVSIRDNRSGEIFACPKSICEVFEISWSSQRQKLIMNLQRWSYKTIMIVLPGDIQQREVGVIPDNAHALFFAFGLILFFFILIFPVMY